MSSKNKHIKIKNEKKNNKNNEVKGLARTNKSKKSKLGLYFKIVLIILLGVFLYFAVISTSNSYKGSIFERLDILKQDKKPYLVVIRDDFSPVSDKNRKVIDNIISQADKSLTVFDISYNPNDISKEAQYFIDKFELESLPVIILGDEKGDIINSYYLPLNEKQIIGIVDKARESSEE